MALLAGREAAKSSLQVLASGCAWLTETLRPTTTTVGEMWQCCFNVDMLRFSKQNDAALCREEYVWDECAAWRNCAHSPVVFFQSRCRAGLVLEGKAGVIWAVVAGSRGAGTTGACGYRAGAWQPRWVAPGPRPASLVHQLHCFKHTPRVVPARSNTVLRLQYLPGWQTSWSTRTSS